MIYDKQVDKAIQDLCIFMHTELNSMKTDLDESMPDLEQILALSSIDSVSYIKTTVMDLIRTKHDYQMAKDYKDDMGLEGYEKALQKLESEVRNHIKIEQQMKLHIENTQAKVEEVENIRIKQEADSKKTIEGLNKEIQSLEYKMKDVERTARTRQPRDTGKNLELERKLKSYENDIRKYRHHADERQKDYDRLKREYDKLRVYYYKQKENSQIASNTHEQSQRSIHVTSANTSEARSRSVLAGTTSEAKISNLRKLVGQFEKRYTSTSTSKRSSVSPRYASVSKRSSVSPVRDTHRGSSSNLATTRTGLKGQPTSSLLASRSSSVEKSAMYHTYRPQSSRLRS